ncbi:hypothetical protein COV18_02270 [Candidatus Woesearchaeota archaeon CG10_big_fil_rev_8_21_14_0_10_37_12]|nr:MAG: hypothetical protein COV18_02270 [Candidatus Woesearchaeota archaeon CG10_big_fil_rev_8_21_14_0_10_37_12]
MNLNSVDKKILWALHNNSRLPVSKVAKKCRISREIAEYRIKKLEKTGIIKGFVARVDMSFLCAGVGSALFKLIRFDEKRLSGILDFLKAHRSVNWIAELCGTADIVIVFLYKSSEDLAQIITEISEFIGSNLKEHQIQLYISEYKFSREGLVAEDARKFISPLISFKDHSEKKDLDKIDKLLLGILANNCRIKNIELAKKLKISEDAVRRRIISLEKRGLLLGYSITIDVNKLGFESYYVQLQIDQMTNQTIAKIKYYCETSPYVTYCSRIAGRYNVVMTVCAKNRNHFNDLLRDLRKHFGAQLLDYDFQIDLEEHKETTLPEGFLD